MAKQTFTTGQVLTAAQMTSLQQTAMGGGSATAKTASYVLVAADAGATVIMNAAGATTITVNTSLFSAGDTVFIQNIGAGTCTITPGTATVNTASSLALAQYDSGSLYFTAAGASIFSKADGASAGGGKVLQVVSTTYGTEVNSSSATYVDAGLSLAITPSSASSKVLVLVSQPFAYYRSTNAAGGFLQLVRGATSIYETTGIRIFASGTTPDPTAMQGSNIQGISYLDSPATTSSTTYKMQMRVEAAGSTPIIEAQFTDYGASTATMILLEIGA